MKEDLKLGKMGEGRGYLQFGGPRPTNRLYYYGTDTNYFYVSGVANPVRGGIDPINVADPDNVSSWSRAGRTISPADLPSFDLTINEKVGGIPSHYLDQDCVINVYEVRGRCRSLADFDLGWEDYVSIYSNCLVSDRDEGDRYTREGDDPLEVTLGMTAEAIYKVGALNFAERNQAGITLEIMAICYGNKAMCGECGPSNDGTRWIYMVEKGAVGAPPIVHYSIDGGANWLTQPIAAAANAEAPTAIGLMGGYLVVLSPTANSATQGGYYYAPVNPVTGVPGAFVKVTAGFTNARKPNDMVVIGPREAYICADGGEVLKITDVLRGADSLGVVTTNNLTRIAARGNVIVAVGASATVVRSLNRGKTFSVTTTSPGAAALTSVEVLDRNRVWVGNASGAVYHTNVGGEIAWTQTAIGGTPASIQDIVAATDEVLYAAYVESGVARLATSLNGGQSWVTGADINPRLMGLKSTPQRYNRIAVPQLAGKHGTNANNVLLAGLGVTTDGTLYQGVANII